MCSLNMMDSEFNFIERRRSQDVLTQFRRNDAHVSGVTEAVRKQIKAKTIILDSEALAYNPESEEFLPFQETTKRRRKHGIAEMAKSLPLKAFVFDILYKDGESLIDQPLTKKWKSSRRFCRKMMF